MRDAKHCTGVVLAGGFSSRMGRSKAELELNGKTLLEHQVEKLQALGLHEIIISGDTRPVEGTRFVPDVYPHRGPLSGIHACLQAAEAPCCLFVSVDTPLTPPEALQSLLDAHEGGVTALCHGGKLEPLMAVYDSCLAAEAGRILQTKRTAIMRLLDVAGCRQVEYTGDLALLVNCNTPEEFAALQELADR